MPSTYLRTASGSCTPASLPQTGEVLAGSDISGQQVEELVGIDQFLAPFAFPRFSPDGSIVAFASADQTGAMAPDVKLVSLERGSGGTFSAATTMTLDGLPQDIWTVEAEGGTAVRVADLKEDLPSLTWDGSGERIYALGVDGLYEVNLTTGAVVGVGGGRIPRTIGVGSIGAVYSLTAGSAHSYDATGHPYLP